MPVDLAGQTREKKIMNFVDKLKLPILVFVALILAIYPIVSQAVAPESQPVMEIPSPRHDAGTHWEGAVVNHSFEVKNTGSSELKILNVKPG